MKLPNGYGSVYKLSGNRRRPWIARKTTGWDENGKQLYYTIGYYETRKKALAALAEYNKNPIASRRDIKLEELYNEWYSRQKKEVSTSSLEGYRTAWKHLSEVGNMKVRNIKKTEIQGILDKLREKNYSKSAMQKTKMLAGMLFDYAMEDDIVDKNYAKLAKLPKTEKTKKDIFTSADILKIEKAAKTDIWASTIFIMIYTGMRPGELLSLTKFNVDIKNMIITGGIKTDAGKDRIVPIHHKIQPYIKYFYEQNGEYLIDVTGSTIKHRVDNYRRRYYYPTLDKLEIQRLNPHCCRHTFASLMHKANVDTKSIQELIGHADYSTTANIYTHLDMEELKEAIAKI